MHFSLSSSPHQHVQRDTGQVMRLVLYALLPGMACQVFMFGWGIIIQVCIALITAIVCEAAVLALRGKNIERALSDYSAAVTALLLAISIPPMLPWWMTVIGTFFAIVIVKQLYGGLGFNLFNPAMAAYVMLLISFPAAMSSWLPPQSMGQYDIGFMDAFHLIFTGFSNAGYSLDQLRVNADGFTMATPLDSVKTALTQGLTYSESLEQSIFSGGPFASSGAGWAWISVAYGLGGLALVKAKVIQWHIPVAVIAAVAITGLVLTLIDSDHFPSPLFHLFKGSVIFGAFFIATDPVSASTTNRGRLIYGAAIGFWIVIIRTFGGYPDAVAFAVVILNMAVPLIDYYTQPRAYGHSKSATTPGRTNK
jgi:electron transport complex protein RnfD